MNSENKVVPELVQVVEALAKVPGMSVHLFPSGRLRESWVIVARDGNVGSVEYDRLNGYGVSFAIRPSREYGSGLVVSVPCGPGEEALDPRANRGERDPSTVAEIVQAATIATSASYRNFAVPRAMPNHGWEHFAWCRDRLVQLAP